MWYLTCDEWRVENEVDHLFRGDPDRRRLDVSLSQQRRLADASLSVQPAQRSRQLESYSRDLRADRGAWCRCLLGLANARALPAPFLSFPRPAPDRGELPRRVPLVRSYL